MMSYPYYRALQPLELGTIVTPFGVRFWDAACEAAIGPGLVLEAWPEEAPRLRRRATLSRAGIYSLRDLPGMAASERPSAGAGPISPPVSRRFVMEVHDSQGRFLPAVLRADLPYRGIFPMGSLTGAEGAPGFFLFAAATRPAAGMAVVRVELEERVSQRPAAHAVVEVQGLGGPWYGLADAGGAAVVMFGYPAFGATPPTSLPRPAEAARRPQRWPITVRVRYEPGARIVPPGTTLPELASIFAQAPAAVCPTAAGPGAAELGEELSFGNELVLASTPHNKLLVE